MLFVAFFFVDYKTEIYKKHRCMELPLVPIFAVSVHMLIIKHNNGVTEKIKSKFTPRCKLFAE